MNVQLICILHSYKEPPVFLFFNQPNQICPPNYHTITTTRFWLVYRTFIPSQDASFAIKNSARQFQETKNRTL